MSSARRIDRRDYPLIESALREAVEAAANRKAWAKGVSLPKALRSIYEFHHAYIVADAYLVVFEIGTPWHSTTTFLHELLVLRLAPGDFSRVPAFLEAQAREAGCDYVLAGTALAKSDRALASLYARHGFQPEGVSLTKEL